MSKIPFSDLERQRRLAEITKRCFRASVEKGKPQAHFILWSLQNLRAIYLESSRLCDTVMTEEHEAGRTYGALADASGMSSSGVWKRLKRVDSSTPDPNKRYARGHLSPFETEALIREQRLALSRCRAPGEQDERLLQPLVAEIDRSLQSFHDCDYLEVSRHLFRVERLAFDAMPEVSFRGREAGLTWRQMGVAAGSNEGAAFKTFGHLQTQSARGLPQL